MVNAVLLRPLPYPASDRLVLFGYTFSGASAPVVSEAKLNVWKEPSAAWQDVGALRGRRVNVSDGSRAEQVVALQTNTALFTLIDAQAAIGRLFTAAEDRPGGDRVALLSDGFWKRRFGSDPHVVGTRLHVDGEIATIVGVLGGNTDTAIFKLAPDLWMPLQLDPQSTDQLPSLIAGARLAPGITLAMARGQPDSPVKNSSTFSAGERPERPFTKYPVPDRLVGDGRPSLLVLWGAVACVLLIACANSESRADSRGQAARDRDPGRNRRESVDRSSVAAESVLLAFVGSLLAGTVGIDPRAES